MFWRISQRELERLNQLSVSRDQFQRCQAAFDKRLPRELLNMLLSDINGQVREIAAQNAQLTESDLFELSARKDGNIRRGIVQNRNASVGAMIRCWPGSNWYVKEVLEDYLKTVPEDKFKQGLVEAGYPDFVGLPRDWVLKALD